MHAKNQHTMPPSHTRSSPCREWRDTHESTEGDTLPAAVLERALPGGQQQWSRIHKRQAQPCVDCLITKTYLCTQQTARQVVQYSAAGLLPSLTCRQSNSMQARGSEWSDGCTRTCSAAAQPSPSPLSSPPPAACGNLSRRAAAGRGVPPGPLWLPWRQGCLRWEEQQHTPAHTSNTPVSSSTRDACCARHRRQTEAA